MKDMYVISNILPFYMSILPFRMIQKMIPEKLNGSKKFRSGFWTMGLKHVILINSRCSVCQTTKVRFQFSFSKFQKCRQNVCHRHSMFVYFIVKRTLQKKLYWIKARTICLYMYTSFHIISQYYIFPVSRKLLPSIHTTSSAPPSFPPSSLTHFSPPKYILMYNNFDSIFASDDNGNRTKINRTNNNNNNKVRKRNVIK